MSDNWLLESSQEVIGTANRLYFAVRAEELAEDPDRSRGNWLVALIEFVSTVFAGTPPSPTTSRPPSLTIAASDSMVYFLNNNRSGLPEKVESFIPIASLSVQFLGPLMSHALINGRRFLIPLEDVDEARRALA